MPDEIETADADVPALPPPDGDIDVESRAAGDASEDPLYRRVVSDGTRKLFANAAKKLAEQIADGGDDGMEPAIPPPDDKPVAAVGAAAPSPGAAAIAQPAAAAPALDAVANRRGLELDVREQAITARESELAAKEKSGTTMESFRDRYADKPTATLTEVIKLLTGADDTELKDEVMDIMVLLSEDVLGVPAGKDVKLAVDAKRAVRTVKQYKAEQAKREAADKERVAKERADVEQERLYKNAREGIAAHLPTIAATCPDLMLEDNPHEIVWSVIMEQRKRAPNPDEFVPDLAKAIELANNHFQALHDKQRQKLSNLPTPATKPAVVTSTQGAAQSRAARSLTNAVTAPLAPTAPVDSDEPYDKHKARRTSMARVAAAIKERTA